MPVAPDSLAPASESELVRRADVLQRLADQLADQLGVERRANTELRALACEPGRDATFYAERVAAGRFLTFATVAIATAAAVAVLVAAPWERRGVYLSGPPRLELRAPADLVPSRPAIVPFTVVGTSRTSCDSERGGSGVIASFRPFCLPFDGEVPYVP